MIENKKFSIDFGMIEFLIEGKSNMKIAVIEEIEEMPLLSIECMVHLVCETVSCFSAISV